MQEFVHGTFPLMDTKTCEHAPHIHSTFIPSRRADCEDDFMTLKKSVVLLRFRDVARFFLKVWLPFNGKLTRSGDLSELPCEDLTAGAPCSWACLTLAELRGLAEFRSLAPCSLAPPPSGCEAQAAAHSLTPLMPQVLSFASRKRSNVERRQRDREI